MAFLGVIERAKARGPQVCHCDLALLELLLHIGRVGHQKFRVHIGRQRLHRRQSFFTSLAVDVGLVAVLEERAAIAKEQIDEILAEVEAGFHRRAQRIGNFAGRFDLFGSGQHFVIGFGRGDAEFLEQILAVDEMLGIDHHGDGHDLAIDLDKLVGRQVLAVFCHKRVQRADRALVQQGDQRLVGDAADLVQGRVGRESRRFLGRKLLVKRGFEIAAFGHRVGHGLPGGKACGE